jgi:N-acyl homoserine lactone hydrolase
MVLSIDDIRRLYLGHFTPPSDHPLAGQKITVCAYLIRHPRGIALFDTGIGEGDPEAERTYRPVRHSLRERVKKAGVDLADVRAVANCHLHFDHSGSNMLFPKIPIFTQGIEHTAAQVPDYTLPVVVDFPGAAYELIDGEAEVWEGVRIVPTPGHVPGHQSMIVDTRQGTVVLAGQAVNSTSDYSRAQFAWDLERKGLQDDLSYPAWITRLQEFDPWRVFFAHDTAIWEADPKEPAPAE